MAPSAFMRSLSSTCLCHMYLISCRALTLSHKGCICIVLGKHTWQHLGEHIPSLTALPCHGSSPLGCCSRAFSKCWGQPPLHPLRVPGCLCWHGTIKEEDSHAPLSTQAWSHEPLFLQKHSWAWKLGQAKSRNVSNKVMCESWMMLVNLSAFSHTVNFACHCLFAYDTLTFNSGSRRGLKKQG